MIYQLCKETVVDTTMEQAWSFISNPANLNLITPDDMRFTIVTNLPERMYEGMLVEYRVRIPYIGEQPWLSELKNIETGRSFVDVQLVGPYKLWHHSHVIEPVDGKVRFVDRITYQVPCALFGRIARSLFIRKTLDRIFDYREKRLQELLSTGSD
jgi:ligand-binding SRPBCC domain-containing protein